MGTRQRVAGMRMGKWRGKEGMGTLGREATLWMMGARRWHRGYGRAGAADGGDAERRGLGGGGGVGGAQEWVDAGGGVGGKGGCGLDGGRGCGGRKSG
uniref:Uncharacterized protein n=1 Tax=Oryza sativa subsp. japonica TaxID=39947 RepID=Q6Z0H7_ORYSJ|nr:hypothetical protein [Oryza sativa Japonica Group]BAD03629.1 hypothetical protein [Oryza sativa Japonica Group]